MSRVTSIRRARRVASAGALSFFCVWAIGCTEPMGDGFGEVDGGQVCLECHLESGPLIDRLPNTDTDTDSDTGDDVATASLVTGHTAHWSAGYNCDVCHLMPANVGDPTHVDPPPAEVVFSGLSVSGGARPVWNAFTGRCEATYCHGGLSAGGTFSAPSFADGPAATATCGSCHGNPPETGAHARHVFNGVLCTECHIVPLAVSDFGHVDGAPAEVFFSGRAQYLGLAPFYANGQCTNTYCHGTTLGSGRDPSPSWVPLGAGTTSCDTCHGNPPLSSHFEDNTDCASCHPYTVNPDGTINQQTGFHINGFID